MDFREYHLFPSIWHLYLSLIFICGLSKMTISSLKLCMYCSTAGISDLKTFVQFLHFICFLVSPETVRELLLACWRAVPGCSGLQDTYGGGSRASSSLDTTPEPFAFPLQQQWAASLLSHLCFSLFLWVSPCCFLGCAFWVLFSPLVSSPQRAQCFSLAVAIEITEHFSLPLRKALLSLCSLAGWASCLIPNMSAFQNISFPCSTPCDPTVLQADKLHASVLGCMAMPLYFTSGSQ